MMTYLKSVKNAKNSIIKPIISIIPIEKPRSLNS
jgi:hypothetical protein